MIFLDLNIGPILLKIKENKFLLFFKPNILIIKKKV